MKKDLFMKYEEAKEYLKDKNIKSQRDYGQWIKGKSAEFRLPAGPRKFYKNEWVNWGDYLGNNSIAYIDKRNIFYSYEDCSKFVIENNIKSRKEYRNFLKLEILDFSKNSLS